MNKALVELIRKYDTQAKRMQSKSFKAVMFYIDASKSVLALAKQ